MRVPDVCMQILVRKSMTYVISGVDPFEIHKAALCRVVRKSMTYVIFALKPVSESRKQWPAPTHRANWTYSNLLGAYHLHTYDRDLLWA